MASVDWYKVTTQAAGGMRVHFDAEKRVQGNHANKDIDKSKSHLNLYIGAPDYKEMLDIIKKRVKNVDEEFPPERLRKDRKTMTILETPVPQAVADAGKAAEFLRDCHEEFIKYFGAENVGGTVCHFDEVHPYTDKDGKERMSLIHGHTLVANYVEWSEKNKETGEIEERKGINGKNFETRKRLKALNKAIHEMCLERYGVSFNTGLTAEKKQIEVLKHESLVRENDELSRKNAEKDEIIEEKERIIAQKDKIIEEKDKEIERLQERERRLQEQALEYEIEPKGKFERESHYNARKAWHVAQVGVKHADKENARREQNNANESQRLANERFDFEEYSERKEKQLRERTEEVARKEANIDGEITKAAYELNSELLDKVDKLTERVNNQSATIEYYKEEKRLDTQEIAQLKDRIEELENPRQSYGYGLKM